MQLPGRFDCTYIDANGEKVTPLMIHRAIFGSIERFTGIITEHFKGAFPTFLAPRQVVILPVNNSLHLDYANKVNEALLDNKVRSEVNKDDDKLGYKLRECQVKKVPYTIVIGDNEMKDNTVTYRILGTKEQVTVPLDDFIKLIKEDIDTRKTYRI